MTHLSVHQKDKTRTFFLGALVLESQKDRNF